LLREIQRLANHNRDSFVPFISFDLTPGTPGADFLMSTGELATPAEAPEPGQAAVA
jgi:hypothetical protein